MNTYQFHSSGGQQVISIHFPIKPEPKLRARKGKNGWYTPEKTKKFEDQLKFYARAALPDGFEPMDQPIDIILNFGIIRPKSHPDRKFPSVKPDLDNLVKSTCDALNGIIWKDDGAICRIHTAKSYTDKNFIDLKILESH